MRVELTGVAKGRGGAVLAPIDLAFASGEVTLATAETEQRPTILGLIASGRMRADAGTVTLDGRPGSRAIRRRVALVDAPDVCDPAPDVSVLGVVSEELMFAGRRSDPFAALDWLADHDLRSLTRVPVGRVDADTRVRMLLELAVLRAGVEGVVLVSPDRHGGDPRRWWEIAEEVAARGLAVLVIAGEAAATALADATPVHAGGIR
ncbi:MULTISPECIES: hypothetical protein [unclassified Microbacterium]|uniref:hypothetical protein n=1 Tax=unclassified Microbacterium TaxID=2609290 RepID=UPI00386A9E6A